MSLFRDLLHIQIVIVFSAQVFSVHSTHAVRDYLRNTANNEVDNYTYVKSALDSSREKFMRSYRDKLTEDVVPSLYLNRAEKQLFLTHINKSLIRKIKMLLDEENNYRTKRNGNKKKYISDAAPCFFKLCNLGKRRVAN